jgi:hypothetical protein
VGLSARVFYKTTRSSKLAIILGYGIKLSLEANIKEASRRPLSKMLKLFCSYLLLIYIFSKNSINFILASSLAFTGSVSSLTKSKAKKIFKNWP